MSEFLSRGAFRLSAPVRIESHAAVVGDKEGRGPLGKCFDEIISDSHFGRSTWEQAESRFQLEAVSLAVKKAGLVKEDIDSICSGDLINQCTGSSYGLRELGIPFLGTSTSRCSRRGTSSASTARAPLWRRVCSYRPYSWTAESRAAPPL